MAALIDPESLYVQLGRLAETAPPFWGTDPLPANALQWLGRVAALINATGDLVELASFHTAMGGLNRGTMRYHAAQDVLTILYRVLAKAELNAPIAAQGAFIPAKNSFDAFAAIGKVLATATRDVLIIDPYMDEKALTDFIVLVPAGVPVRLLADQQNRKPTLLPAKQRWEAQYGTDRPLAVRLATPRTLHDRVIIVDSAGAWVLTQSLNAFAARAPAAIIRADDETAALKIAAYEAIWNASSPIYLDSKTLAEAKRELARLEAEQAKTEAD